MSQRNHFLRFISFRINWRFVYFAGKCPLEELRELPVRLIDWFHVLKINQRQKEFTDQRIEGEELLPRMQFSEAKLKALCKYFLGFTLSLDHFESLLRSLQDWKIKSKKQYFSGTIQKSTRNFWELNG